MTRKALPNVLLHKSEVTYRDTGVSKNIRTKLNISAILMPAHSFLNLIPYLHQFSAVEYVTAENP